LRFVLSLLNLDSFVVSALILTGINLIPGLKLRVSAEEENLGTDKGQMGEVGQELIPLYCYSLTAGNILKSW
jgi:ammonia channel protein AmtB